MAPSKGVTLLLTETKFMVLNLITHSLKIRGAGWMSDQNGACRRT